MFPVKYNVKKSFESPGPQTTENQPLQNLPSTSKEAFDYFEEKKLPVILINKKGEYIID
jgi:hypothetical protein